MLRFHQTPRPLVQLVTALLLTPPTFTFANPNPHERELAGFSFNELFARWDCSGTACGSEGQFCCSSGQSCTTTAGNIAACVAPVTSAATGSGSGSWQYYTSTWVETDLVTRTSTWSEYVGAGATATDVACNYALNESPCNTICCASDQYCFSPGQCRSNANGGSSGAAAATYTTPGATAGAPIRPTTSGQLTVTATKSPTTTVPFETPVATGANITLSGAEETSGGGGLSGGAIAGIVIGVLAGLLLLGLLCFCCCLKGLLDGCLACFGLGGKKKNRRRTEIDEYERHSHHASGGGGGSRTWYGTARPPARVDRRDRRGSSSGKNLLGVGAGLATLWAVLGLKRKRDGRRNDEKSEYSYSSDYYTSASSASSDDRRTHGTRYSRR